MSITIHCSGCEAQMTPAVEGGDLQGGVHLADQYTACDPKRQCCPSAQASARSLWSDISSYTGLSLAAAIAGSDAGLSLVAIKTMREAWQFMRAAEAEKRELPKETKDSLVIVNLCLDAFRKYKGLAALAQHHNNSSLSVFATRRQAAAIDMALEHNEKARHGPVILEAEAFVLAVQGRASAIPTADIAPVEAARRHLARAVILHAGLDILLQLEEKLPESWDLKGANIDRLAESIGREFSSAEGCLTDASQLSQLAKVRFSAVEWFNTMAGIYRGRKEFRKVAEYADMAIYFSTAALETYDRLAKESNGLERARHLIFKAHILSRKAVVLENRPGKDRKQTELAAAAAYREEKLAINEAVGLIRAVKGTGTSNLLRHALALQYGAARRESKTEVSPSAELERLYENGRAGEMLRGADMGNPYDRELVVDVLDIGGDEIAERLLTEDPEFKDRLRQRGLDDDAISSLTESARRNLGESGIRDWRRRTRAVK